MTRHEIRHIQANDSLDELTSLIHRSFAHLGRLGLNCSSLGQSVEETRRRARRGECFVALSHGQLVGTMTLMRPQLLSNCHWYRRHDVASLHQLAVDPSQQGLGCGKALLEHARAWALDHAYCELALDTPASATHLIAYYASRGFRVVEEVQMLNRPYKSAVLSRTITRTRPHQSLWYSPHRMGHFGSLVRL